MSMAEEGWQQTVHAAIEKLGILWGWIINVGDSRVQSVLEGSCYSVAVDGRPWQATSDRTENAAEQRSVAILRDYFTLAVYHLPNTT